MCVFAKCLDPVPRQKQLATDRANTFARQKQRLATRRISHSSETGSCDTGSTSLLRNSVWRHVGSTTSLTRHSWRHTGPTTSLVKQRLPTHRINDFAHHTVDDRQDQQLRSSETASGDAQDQPHTGSCERSTTSPTDTADDTQDPQLPVRSRVW